MEIAEDEIVTLDEPMSALYTVGGPIALMVFFFGLVSLVFILIPYEDKAMTFDLRELPVAAQRGIGMSVIMFGIAFVFGGFEAYYMMQIHGSVKEYFDNMSDAKLIAVTHAHLFGFTTTYFIIGIPFSLHFSHFKPYQYIFPTGLAASLTDMASWWGIKYVSDNFEIVTQFCGIVFSVCYMFMLIALVRTLFFPKLRWFSDRYNTERKKQIAGKKLSRREHD